MARNDRKGPDPDDDLVWTANRAELRGAQGHRHLSRQQRPAIEGQSWAIPGRSVTARCGASVWLAGATEDPTDNRCGSCFKDQPEEET